MRPKFFCCLDIYIIGNNSLSTCTNKFWASRGKCDSHIFQINVSTREWVLSCDSIEDRIWCFESTNLIFHFEWYQPLGETHFISYIISVCERKATQIQKYEENEQWVTSATESNAHCLLPLSLVASTWNEHNWIFIASYMLVSCLLFTIVICFHPLAFDLWWNM